VKPAQARAQAACSLSLASGAKGKGGPVTAPKFPINKHPGAGRVHVNDTTSPPTQANERARWAARITATWRQSVESIIECGRLLIAAKGALPHGAFLDMIENDLPFGPRTGQRLMKIAVDPRLTNATHVSLLPPSWGTLYQLTRLDDGTFARLVDDGTIRPDMERSEVGKVLRIARVTEDEQRVRALVPVVGKFRTIVIDPAWEYDWLSVAGRAKPGYAMQSIEELRALDVRAWADEEAGCHLYCWATNNFSGEAHKLVEHWGFQHRTVLTWIKPPPFGLGSYFRNSTELVLFATLGDTTTAPAAARIPTHFEAPRGEHSEKPERFYEIVRAASYPPYGEANQRKARPDFTNLFTEPLNSHHRAGEKFASDINDGAIARRAQPAQDNPP
jgi:N6-adenosine-specific RNA methylase IME4